MTNEPGMRMLVEQLKLKLASFLKMFNVSLPAQQPQHSSSGNAFGSADASVNYPTLEIGNELLITDDTVKVYKGLSNVLGRVVIIDQIPAVENAAVKASAFGIQVNVDLKMAQHMREAYIFREQASSAT